MFTTTAKDEGHKRVKRSLNVSESFPSHKKTELSDLDSLYSPSYSSS
jgi:hypothetical protein